MRADYRYSCCRPGQPHEIKNCQKCFIALLASLCWSTLSSVPQHTQRKVGEGKIHVVIGHGAEQVKAALGHYDLNWVVQEEQLGTGPCGFSRLCRAARVLMLCWYSMVMFPLIHSSSLQSLLAASNGERLGLLDY